MIEHEKMIWRFTIKRGVVKNYGPRDPIPPEELMRTDEDGEEFLHIPALTPRVVAEIAKAVRDNSGRRATGEGTYDDSTGLIEFEPAVKIVN
jgi:hypothetical protein